MRVTVVRIITAVAVALCVGSTVAVPTGRATAAPFSSLPAQRAAQGLRQPGPCLDRSPGNVPIAMSAGSAELPAGYWFEECRIPGATTLRNLTPSVWAVNQSGFLRVERASPLPQRFLVFHSSDERDGVSALTIAPGETLTFSGAWQLTLTHDPHATATWLASRATTKWFSQVTGGRIDLRKEWATARLSRQGTAGAALVDCHGAVAAADDWRKQPATADVVDLVPDAVSTGMKSRACVTALERFRVSPSIVEDAATGSDDLARTVASSVAETGAVSLYRRFAPVFRAALR